MVVIPILGLQTDPDYYPNPEIYDPDRYSDANKNNRTAFTWMPFGEGPRICIGSSLMVNNARNVELCSRNAIWTNANKNWIGNITK